MKYHGRVALSFFAMILSLLLVLFSVVTLPLDPVLVGLSLLLYIVGFVVLPKHGKEAYYQSLGEAKEKRSKSSDKKTKKQEEQKAKTVTVKKKDSPQQESSSQDKPTKTTAPQVRYSHSRFPEFDFENTGLLKYSYYDVEINPATFTDSEISKIRPDTLLQFHLDDDRSVTVLDFDNTVIGTLPDGRLKDMLFDYSEKKNATVAGFISQIDDSSKRIQIALGFYQYLSETEFENLPHVDASLIKTKAKDYLGSSRMDNLLSVGCGDKVTLEYDYDTETYIVSNAYGDELGEINVKNSEKLQVYENEGSDLFAYILSVDDEDIENIKCRVRVVLK